MLLKINIKLNIILIILLITSLGFNFRFRVLLQTARLQMNEISLNPVNLKRYPQENIATEKIMVMFGDSRIVAWRKPQLEDFLIINRGISGETSSQALLRFDYHVSYLQPKIILIQVGVNDLRMRTITTDRQEIIADCKHNIRSIVQKSLELDSLVILTTIFPLGEGNIPSQFTTIWPSKAAIVTAIEEVNSYIRSLATENQVIILETSQIIAKNGVVKPEYARDILHINRQGYQALNQKLTSILARQREQLINDY